MKKIFTLIATVIVALCANASTMLTPTFNPWGENAVVDGYTITYTEAWAGVGAWLAGGDEEGNYLGCDLSANEYLWITVAEGATVDVKLVVQYTGSCVAGASGTSEASVMAGSLVAGCALDPAQKNDVSQFFLQSTSGAGSLTVTGIYVGSKEEYDAAMAGDVSEKVKDLTLPGDNGVIVMPGEQESGWYSPGWNGLTSLDAMFKTLVFEVASADEHYQLMVQGSEDGSTWDATGFTTFSVAGHTTPAVIALPVEGKHVNLGQFAFQNMNVIDSWMDPATGAQVSEYGDNKVVVTRVYLTSNVVESNYVAWTDGISEVKAEASNGVMYNIAGQRISKANGLYIMNGKKYFVK